MKSTIKKQRDQYGGIHLSSDEKKRYIYWIVLILLVILCLYRSFYGFDWSDESYYIALPYRFILGDSLFFSSWDIHQLSAIIMLPLQYVFLFFSSGSTTGILLFMRISFIAFQALTGAYVFHVLSKKIGYAAAIIPAAMLILFVPFCINNFSYNTLALLFLVLSLFLLYDAGSVEKWCRLKCFFGGVTFALAIQSYPYLVIALPVFLICCAIFSKKKKKAGSNISAFLYCLIGLLSVGASFILFVFCNSSIANFFSNLKFLLSDPAHQAISFTETLRKYIVSIHGLIGSAVYGITVITAVAFGYSFLHNSRAKCILKAVLYITCLILMVWCICRAATVPCPLTTRINMFAVPLALIGPAVYCLNDRKYDISICLYFAGLFFSLAVQFASNTRFNGSSYPLILSSIAVIMYCGKYRPRIDKAQFLTASTVMLEILICIGVLGGIAYTRITDIYRDEKLPYLTKQIQSGPAAGIFTTEVSAEKYEAVVSAISTYAPKSGTVFYTKLLPFGYLCTNLRPATPTIWTTSLNSPRLKQYFELHSNLKPDFIFVVDEAYGISNEDNSIESYLAEDILRGKYKKLSLDCGIIYIREEDDKM